MDTTRRDFIRTLARGAVVGAGIAAGQAVVRFPLAAPLLAAPARIRYSTATDPFAMDGRLKAISASVPSGDTQAKVSWIFNRLNRYAAGGVKVMSMTGKPPRTAPEALVHGGDCTDLANIVIAIFRQHGIPGGVMAVHFSNAPAGVDHLVPYALIGGKKVIVDLQTNALGRTAEGKYDQLMDISYDRAAGMYHREMGDHLRGRGDLKIALMAYKRSLEINEPDPYVHQNAAVLYGKAGDHAAALKHMGRAAELDKSYARHLPGAVFNAGLQEGQNAYREGRYADCAAHFQSALDSGHLIPSGHRKALEGNIRLCKSKSGTD